MFKKTLIATLLAAAMLFSSCSSSKYGDSETNHSMMGNASAGGGYNEKVMMEESPITDDCDSMETEVDYSNSPKSDGISTVAADASDRKIITNISYRLQTKEFSKTITTLNEQIKNTNSFVQHSSNYGDEDNGDAGASFTIRVPIDSIDEFKKAVPTLGNITNTNESGEDVTGEFFDTEARIKVLTAQEDTVIELLEMAVNIEEVMLIQTELTRIRTEIEQLTTVIKRLSDLTSYATITIDITQTKDYVIAKQSFFDKVGDVFKDSLNGFIDVLAGFGTVFVWLLPYLIIGGVILIIILRYHKKHKKVKSIENTPYKVDSPEDKSQPK